MTSEGGVPVDADGCAGQCVSVDIDRSDNGYANGKVNGCILPWMTKWVWDNSSSWEEEIWDDIDGRVGCPATIDVKREGAQGNIVIEKPGGIKEMSITQDSPPKDRWTWKEGSGWYCPTNGKAIYNCCPSDIVVLTVYAVVSCLAQY